MENAYANAQMLFYAGLRKNGLVKGLGCETVIRDLTDKILMYIEHANMATMLLHNHGITAETPFFDCPANKGVEQNTAPDWKPMRLDFSQIGQIAYDACIDGQRRGIAKFLLGNEPSLEHRLKGYKNQLECYENGLALDKAYFDVDTWQDLSFSMGKGQNPEDVERAVNNLYERSVELLKAESTLIRLARASSWIKRYYWEEKCRQLDLRTNLHDQDIVLPGQMISMPRLKDGAIGGIADYFTHQAKINQILFKIMYAESLRYYDIPEALKQSDAFHRTFIKKLDKQGFIEPRVIEDDTIKFFTSFILNAPGE